MHIDGGDKITEPVRMDEPVMAVEDTQHNIFSDAVDTLDNYNRAPVADMNSICAQKQAIDDGINNNDEQTGPPIPKQEGLITLSGLPAAHWNNLFHLNLVKERNKPTEAPKKPPSAPFFLQWRADTTTAANSKGEGDALKQNPLGAAGGEGTSSIKMTMNGRLLGRTVITMMPRMS